MTTARKPGQGRTSALVRQGKRLCTAWPSAGAATILIIDVGFTREGTLCSAAAVRRNKSGEVAFNGPARASGGFASQPSANEVTR
jgi:hypothetical protein